MSQHLSSFIFFYVVVKEHISPFVVVRLWYECLHVEFFFFSFSFRAIALVDFLEGPDGDWPQPVS